MTTPLITIIGHLVDKYDLDDQACVRLIDAAEGYSIGAVECNGRMPNSTEYGWFFAGYIEDLSDEVENHDL